MDFGENSERLLNWRGLTEHPVLADGQEVSLISKISGTIIESFGKKRGFYTSLSVHRSAPEYFDVRKDIKVHAFLPGELSDTELECLHHLFKVVKKSSFKAII